MSKVIAGLIFLFSSFSFGQNTAERKPEFDVVDVKLNTTGARDLGSGKILPSGQFQGINIPLVAIIQFAYGVRAEAIVGAPNWVNQDRYDVIGKGPAVGSERTFWPNMTLLFLTRESSGSLPYQDETFRLMVQSLLADRFKMAAHTDQKPTDIFALVVSRGGSKMQPAADSSIPGDCLKTNDGVIHAACKNMNMADLARMLPSFAPAYVDRQVVDFTGIKGGYDFRLDWVGKGVAEQQGGMTLPAALEKATGLRLEERKQPMPVVIIDHIERPSEN
jgi:bla regulator protein BlaR1